MVHPKASSGTADYPQNLVSGVISFLSAHDVVLFVGFVAWLGGDGGVIWGFVLPSSPFS